MARKKATSQRGSRKRRGTSEDMTGKKDGQVEVRKAFSQSEMSLPPVEDYQHHRKTIMGYLDQLKSAQGRYRKALKAAQAVGIDTDAMLEAKRIKDANDPKKTAHKLNQLAFALEQEGVPIHITVTDTLVSEVMEDAYSRGYADGADGKTAASRYPEGSDMDREYTRGWHHGTGKNLNLTPEQVDAALEKDAA